MFILNSLREFVRTQGLDASRPRGASRRAHRTASQRGLLDGVRRGRSARSLALCRWKRDL